MQVSKCIRCETFPCTNVIHEGYILPEIDLDPDRIRMVLISETSPQNSADTYYAQGDPLFQRTTVMAFNDAGAKVCGVNEILDMGIYLTTAVKCAKPNYEVESQAVQECSILLERELNLFTDLQVIMAMGDVAIKSLNIIAKRNGEPRIIPAGSTYKLRGKEYFYRKIRVFPSYLQAGPSFFIEKVKRKMIAEDLRVALSLIG
jgi:uracil-DNA glycosylase